MCPPSAARLPSPPVPREHEQLCPRRKGEASVTVVCTGEGGQQIYSPILQFDKLDRAWAEVYEGLYIAAWGTKVTQAMPFKDCEGMMVCKRWGAPGERGGGY